MNGQCWRGRTSALRHPDLAQAVTDAPPCRAVGRIVALRAGAEARDGESWVEREPRVERGPRLIQPTEMGERGGKPKMRACMISVEFDRAPEPRDRLLISAELQLGQAREQHPDIGLRIARTEAESLLDMALRFLAATQMN